MLCYRLLRYVKLTQLTWIKGTFWTRVEVTFHGIFWWTSNLLSLLKIIDGPHHTQRYDKGLAKTTVLVQRDSLWSVVRPGAKGGVEGESRLNSILCPAKCFKSCSRFILLLRNKGLFSNCTDVVQLISEKAPLIVGEIQGENLKTLTQGTIATMKLVLT